MRIKEYEEVWVSKLEKIIFVSRVSLSYAVFFRKGYHNKFTDTIVHGEENYVLYFKRKSL